MSKMYTEYLNLKRKEPEKIYLFKSGIFYIALAEDAECLSKLLGFKITMLNETVVKCGFPIKRLQYYLELLDQQNVQYQIIDNQFGKIDNYAQYISSIEIKEVIEKIKEIDFDNITYKQCFEMLLEMKKKIQNIKVD